MSKNDWRVLLRAPTLTREALRDAYRIALLESGAVTSVEPVAGDPLRLDCKTKQGRPFTAGLDNLFADASSPRPDDRERTLQRYLAASIETARAADGELSAPSRSDVIPTIKSTAWLAGVPMKDLATAPLVADLVVVYSFDRAQSMTYASRVELEALGLSASELPNVALANLRARLPPQLATRGDGKSFLFVAGGNYEASLLLLDEVWAQLEPNMPGDLIACVLARDVCLVTSTELPGGIASLEAARDRICAGSVSNFISKTLLRREDERWVPFGSIH